MHNGRTTALTVRHAERSERPHLGELEPRFLEKGVEALDDGMTRWDGARHGGEVDYVMIGTPRASTGRGCTPPHRLAAAGAWSGGSRGCASAALADRPRGGGEGHVRREHFEKAWTFLPGM